MQFPILIEPIDEGRFRAYAGAPFTLFVEGATEAEATQRLSGLIAERIEKGVRLTTITLPNGAGAAAQTPLSLDALPEDAWFFRTLQEAIAENRHREDEAGR
jgi:predicted RNase H-like HicB family nuclease